MARTMEESWAIHDEMRMVARIRKQGYEKALNMAWGDKTDTMNVEMRKGMNEQELKTEWKRLCDKMQE